MKPFAKYIFGAFIIVFVLITIFMVQHYLFQQKYSDNIAVNNGVVVTKEFSVKSPTPNQNSMAKGTLFVWGDKGVAKRIRIVASYEIDPEDFAGMTVYIPKKWYISNILSSNPVNQKTDLQPRTTQGDRIIDEWRNRVEIGVDSSLKPVGGGTGTIMIDLVSDPKAILPSETFNIMVSLGSDMQNGVKSVGVGYIKIPISVNAKNSVQKQIKEK